MSQKKELAVQRLDVQALIAKAVEGKADVQTLERLFSLAKEIKAEHARDAWHTAMAEFQANVPEIKKVRTAKAGAFQYKYAGLDDILSAIRPVLTGCGLSTTFNVSIDNGNLRAVCKIAHSMGHCEESQFEVPIEAGRMSGPQSVGSASTYAKRYALMSALGLAPEDDTDAQDVGPATDVKRRYGAPRKVQVDERQVEQRQAEGTVEVIVAKVGAKRGTGSDGKGYTRYTIRAAMVTGEEIAFSTFSKTDAELAKLNSGKPMRIKFKDSAYGYEVETIDPVEA